MKHWSSKDRAIEDWSSWEHSESGQVNWNRSSQDRSSRDTSQGRTSQVGTCPVRTGPVRTGQGMTGQFGQVNLHCSQQETKITKKVIFSRKWGDFDKGKGSGYKNKRTTKSFCCPLLAYLPYSLSG